ncbi:MAG TPA: hypothetical protein EYP14_06465, partial [Planctomycetaceae bacterium]|nr:hypothetical protein [Planctomycetaceae bacterium]
MFRFSKLLTDQPQEPSTLEGSAASVGSRHAAAQQQGNSAADGPADRDEAPERVRRDLALQMQRLQELLDRVESGRLEEESDVESLLTVSSDSPAPHSPADKAAELARNALPAERQEASVEQFEGAAGDGGSAATLSDQSERDADADHAINVG